SASASSSSSRSALAGLSNTPTRRMLEPGQRRLMPVQRIDGRPVCAPATVRQARVGISEARRDCSGPACAGAAASTAASGRASARTRGERRAAARPPSALPRRSVRLSAVLPMCRARAVAAPVRGAARGVLRPSAAMHLLVLGMLLVLRMRQPAGVLVVRGLPALARALLLPLLGAGVAGIVGGLLAGGLRLL